MKQIALSLLLYCFSLSALAADSHNVESAVFSYVEDLLEKSKKASLADKKYWKLLLHYRDNKSVIKDDFFFLAKDGNKNPESELEETIKGFFRADISLDNNHPICRYPARLKWISQKLKISQDRLPKANCAAFKTYMRNTAVNKIYVSFASENVNSLMSMMGHIFLKTVGEKDGREVNHALSYAAVFAPQEALSFVFKAVFLDAPGIYMLEPYDNKIDEYNNNQKRSVWEYELNFTQEQIDKLMFHIWEMKKVNVRYSFINHNCGSALLYLLYVADPNIEKTYSPLNAPIDIVKNLHKNNYIRSIEIFPSDNYKFMMISKNFSNFDRKIMKEFLENGDVGVFNSYKSEQKKSNILYGLRTVNNYKLLNDNISEDEYDASQNKIYSIAETLPKNNLVYEIKDPLRKSNSSRINVGYASRGRDGDIVNFGFYPVYNSLNGDNSEYFNEFDLQLANIEGAYFTDERKVLFDNFDLIKIKSLISYDNLINGLSGSFRINLNRERFDSKSNRMFFNTNAGIGIAKSSISDNVLLYSMANFGYSYFHGNNVSYANPEIGVIVREGAYGKLNAKYSKYITSNRYKYNTAIEINQTFFVNEEHDVMLSLKRNGVEQGKSFNSVSAEYQYHF